MFRRLGFPGTFKRVELHMRNHSFRVIPAVDCALNNIAQFADIARPGVILQLLHHMRGKAGPSVPIKFCRHAPRKIFRQNAHIAVPNAQGGKRDHLKAQPVEQIRAKLA